MPAHVDAESPLNASGRVIVNISLAIDAVIFHLFQPFTESSSGSSTTRATQTRELLPLHKSIPKCRKTLLNLGNGLSERSAGIACVADSVDQIPKKGEVHETGGAQST